MGVYVGAITGTTSDAGQYLSSGWADLNAKADEAFNQAMNIASSTWNYVLPTVGIPSAPEINTSGIAVSTTGEPEAPTLPEASFPTYTVPEYQYTSYTPGPAPDFTSVMAPIIYPTAPDVETPTSPGTAPTISDPNMPDTPVVTLPSVPTMRDIALPDAPEIILPVFSADDPYDDVPEITNPGFIWSEAAYTEKLPQLATKIAQYLAFDYDAAETAIWERGQERIDYATDQAVNDLYNDFAARGFSLPTGSLLAATNEARFKGAMAKYDNARDAMIKAAELNTQKLTLAIESGIKYESMWMNYMTEYYKRSLDAAKITAEIALDIVKVEVSLFNARLEVYKTEAQVHRDLIQAELAKLEAYKAELEGQKLIGQINMQDVELYSAQLKGAITVIDLYKSQISAEVAKMEADKIRVEGFTAEVNAYKAEVDAMTAQYQAWAEQMRGEALKAQVYETEVRAFAAQVDAYKSEESVKIEDAKLSLEENKIQLETFRVQLANLDALVKQYAAEVDAVTKVYDTDAKVYTSVIAAREAEAKMEVSVRNLELDEYKTEASVAIEQMKVNIAEMDAFLRNSLGSMQAAGAIVSQLAASAMSAFNLSASTQEQFSLQVSNALNESYSGQVTP